MTLASDKLFHGSIAELYEKYLVPLIFEPYGLDLARRVAARPATRVLEVAAGTGIVTRNLASTLPRHVTIVATDLNQPMIDLASSLVDDDRVEWRQADVFQLPFEDRSFDIVVCQFGAMFFPDKSRAFAEVLRVLRPGGAFLFSVWDRIEENEFADVVTSALTSIFPDNPPRFLARTPHGYFDRRTIERDVAAAGFTQRPQIETIEARSRASSPFVPAIAYCQGTPLCNEIPPTRLEEATKVAAEAIAARFGRGEVDGKIQAHTITIGM